MTKHSDAISFIRIIAMISIVMTHILQYFGIENYLNVAVYVFLCMSGYLYGLRKITDWGRFYIKNFVKVLVDLYLVLIMFFLADSIISGVLGQSGVSAGQFVKQVLLIDPYSLPGLGHLWFINYILFCYLLTPIFQGAIEWIHDRFSDGFKSLFCFLGIMVIIIVIGIGRYNSACVNCYLVGMIVGKSADRKTEMRLYRTLISCTIRINGTPVPHERYKRFAPTVRYPFLRLFIGSKFLMFFPFISRRYDSLRTRARLASA